METASFQWGFKKDETMTETEIHENAFAKGIRQIAARDQAEARRTREEIKRALGVQKAQYYNRQNGYVKHTEIERAGLLRIFRRHKVSQPWGL